jgi:hypothetical protein
MTKFAGFLLMFAALSVALTATPVAPEVDAATGSSAVALITGALLVYRGRRAK